MNRGLTTDDALRGVQPTPLTRDEWQAMHDASLVHEAAARERTETQMMCAHERAWERRHA